MCSKGVSVAVYALGNRVPEIDPSAFVHPDAVVIGMVHIGSEATVWPGAVLRGDFGQIYVGARTSVQDGTAVHATPDLPTRLGAGSELVKAAALAERAGFEALWVSDHFHPWLDEQGHSPFVWSVLGGIAAVTEKVKVTTAVTCPTVRIHPAVLAQAAATTAELFGKTPDGRGRFSLGVGTGEALNEHVLGDKWPVPAVRLRMLAEALALIRELWKGETVD